MLKSFNDFNKSLTRLYESKNITFNELEKYNDIKAGDYLKGVMWNKSIKLFYGNNYRGNPSEDARMVPSVSKSAQAKDVSFGDVFADAWKETDDFCNKGSYRFVFVFGDEGTSKRIQKTIANLESDVILSWLKSASVQLSTSDPSVFVVPTTIEESAAAIAKAAASFFSKRTIKIDETVSLIARRIIEKQQTIKTVKTELERDNDFETDWGLDSWINYVKEMPGWGQVYQVDADELGYWYTYAIAEEVVKLAEVKFGIAIMKAIQAMVKSGAITADEVNSGVAQVQQVEPDDAVKPSTPNRISAKRSSTGTDMPFKMVKWK